MFRKWFSTPPKPVIPGGDTYGEPKSAKPKPAQPTPSQMKSQEEPRQGSLTSSVSKSSRDSPLRRPNTAKEYSSPTSSFAKVDTSNSRMPTAASPARPSIESRPSNQSRQSSQFTPPTKRQDPQSANPAYLSRTSTMRSSHVDATDESMSEPPPVAYNELEDLKSRIRNLELTRRQSNHRPSQVESIPERPSTSMSMSRPRNVPGSPLNEMRSPSHFSKSQSLLQSALSKAENRVSRDVFVALEAAAQDAMDLSTLSVSTNTATYSSSYAPDNPITDKRFRRTADNLCRSLTELCIALCEDGTPSDMRSESRMSMRRASRESLYQQSQSGMSSTYTRSSTRQGSVLAARNARTADPSFDDGQSLASRQASHRRSGSQSTITMENRFTDNGFRFDDDEELRRPGSVSRTTSSGLGTTDRTRSMTLNPKYSNVSLRGNRYADGTGGFQMHALTSDRAETRSPLSERHRREQQYLQPQTFSSSSTYLPNTQNTIHNHNDIYELPTQAPSPNNEQLPYHRQSNNNTNGTASSTTHYQNTSTSRSTTTTPLGQHTPLHDLSSSAYPFPASSTTTPTSAQSAAIPIPPRTTPTSPLGTSAGGAGSYSSTLTQRIMERRMQQARESQTALSSASAYGSSLPSGQIGGAGSLLNGLPSVAGTGQSNASTTKLSGMSNRSAPRVGLLKPKGYREANSGFGGGVTG